MLLEKKIMLAVNGNMNFEVVPYTRKTREDKAKNEATLALAKAIQSKRIVELQMMHTVFRTPTSQKRM